MGLEQSVRSCYSTWSKNYYQNYYGKNAAYPPVHRRILRSLLKQSKAKNVLDAGCGPASFLRDLKDLRIQRYGFDLTPEMVAEAGEILRKQGDPAGRIWKGSVLDRRAFKAPKGPKAFDSAVCIGVLPHIPVSGDEKVIGNLHAAVKKGGLVVLEARNAFFSLFTQNRYSYDFFLDELIQAGKLKKKAGADEDKLEQALDELKQRFRMDLPPVRKGYENEPGYDQVLSRTHNPVLLKEQFAEAGFADVRLLFYHFHCLPPMLEASLPGFFRKQSIAMEKALDWRGYFMASAFLLAGRKK